MRVRKSKLTGHWVSPLMDNVSRISIGPRVSESATDVLSDAMDHSLSRSERATEQTL